MIPQVGSVRLGKLRPIHVQRILDTMAKAEAASRSRVQAYRVLSASLRQAVRWQLLASDPAQAIQPPRPERPNLTIPDAAMMGEILRAVEGTDIEEPTALAMGTGMRLGELLALRWKDVDLGDGRGGQYGP